MDKHVHTITKSAGETQELARQMAIDIKGDSSGEHKGAKVICLYGDLGSGKTTFVQGFAGGLGLSSRLLSPTFIIVRRHNINGLKGFLYHVDLYRIQNTRELEALGLHEIIAEPYSFVLIEWADRMRDVLPVPRIDVNFASTNSGHIIDVIPIHEV